MEPTYEDKTTKSPSKESSNSETETSGMPPEEATQDGATESNESDSTDAKTAGTSSTKPEQGDAMADSQAAQDATTEASEAEGPSQLANQDTEQSHDVKNQPTVLAEDEIVPEKEDDVTDTSTDTDATDDSLDVTPADYALPQQDKGTALTKVWRYIKRDRCFLFKLTLVVMASAFGRMIYEVLNSKFG